MRLRSLRAWAARLSAEVLVIWHATRDPGCPRHLRWLALALVAYALSPIDLIPDFIPVLGWLDELIILPLALSWLLRRLPPPLLQRACERAANSRAPALLQGAERLGRWWRRGLALLVALYLLMLTLIALAVWLIFFSSP